MFRRVESQAASPRNKQCPSHIETRQYICSANQLAGFYLKRILVVKGLKCLALCLTLFPNLNLNMLTFMPLTF